MMPMLKSAKHAYEATEAGAPRGGARLIALGGAVHPALESGASSRSEPARHLHLEGCSAGRDDRQRRRRRRRPGERMVRFRASAPHVERFRRRRKRGDAIAISPPRWNADDAVKRSEGCRRRGQAGPGFAVRRRRIDAGQIGFIARRDAGVFRRRSRRNGKPHGRASRCRELRRRSRFHQIAATNSDPSSGLGTTSLADIQADIFQQARHDRLLQASRLWLSSRRIKRAQWRRLSGRGIATMAFSRHVRRPARNRERQSPANSLLAHRRERPRRRVRADRSRRRLSLSRARHDVEPTSAIPFQRDRRVHVPTRRHSRRALIAFGMRPLRA